MRREKTNYVIQSVSHALDVLEQFTEEDAELGVTELSKRLKLHKNNVFRLLATLESRGYIEQNKVTENYRLGIRCLHLGQTYIAQQGLLRQAQPVMATLARAARETAFVGVVRNGSLIPLDAAEADQPVRIAANVGEPLPLHCTAAGKAYLAFAPEAERESMLDGLGRRGGTSGVDRGALLAQLDEIGSRGYALELGEHRADVNAIAVPIRDYTRHVVGALSMAGPAYRLAPERLTAEIAPVMLDAGRELSSRLGFEG